MPKPSASHYQIAVLHASNISKGFLSSLGPHFLALMYLAIDQDGNSVIFTEVVDGEIVGFVSGTKGMRPIYRRLMRMFPRVIYSLLPSMFSAKKIFKILETLKHGKTQASHSEIPPVELLSIAVDPAYRGKGIAEKLFNKLSQHYTQQGIPAFKIVVGSNLIPARRFYERMGATPVATTEVHKGEASIVYVKNLTK